MNNTDKQDQKIAQLLFSSVYPLYLQKISKKGRTEQELIHLIEWLSGFDQNTQKKWMQEKINFQTFFERATLNPNASLITGMICGYRIEEIENPISKQVRYLDKLVDELAKGKTMDKILRKAQNK